MLNAVASVAVLCAGGRLIALSVCNLCILGLLAFAWYGMARWVLPAFRLDRRSTDKQQTRSLLKFGGIAFAGRIAETILGRLDTFIIAGLIGVAAVSHFNIAITLVCYFQMVMDASTNGLVNWFAHKIHGEGKGVEQSLLVCTRWCVLVGGFGLFGLVAFGQPFIRRWMGAEYLDAYPCLVALSVGIFLRCCQQSNLQLLYAQARHHLFAIANVLESVLTVAFALLLVRRYGLLGIAAGSGIASAIVNGVVFPLACCRAGGIGVAKYYGTLLWGLAAVSVGIVLPAWLAQRVVASNYLTLICLAGALALVYLPVALALGSTSGERARILREVLFRGSSPKNPAANK